MSDCKRCANTGKVGRRKLNEGTLSECWLIGDWTFENNLVNCPHCRGDGKARNVTGWITGRFKDGHLLSDIGIELTDYTVDEEAKAFETWVQWNNVTVTPEQMEKLDQLFGRFIWGLE